MAKCGVIHTQQWFVKEAKVKMKTSSRILEEEHPAFNAEVNCKLHAFLLSKGLMYVPSNFFVFAKKAIHTKNELLAVTMAAENDCVIRVLPVGYKPCSKKSRRYEQIKAIQPSPHVTIAEIVCNHWKLKGRRDVLEFTVDMVDGGVYDTEGTMMHAYTSVFMMDHFEVIAAS